MGLTNGTPSPQDRTGDWRTNKKFKDSFPQTLPPHIYNALQIWAYTTQETMASPSDYNTQYLHNWSSDP
eukprot:scaffold221560_cov23-Tisochrysis_lutea.AAC.1